MRYDSNDLITKEANEASFVDYERHLLSDKDVKVAYKLNGGFFQDGLNALMFISDASRLEDIPYRNNYEFGGWYLDSNYRYPATKDSIVYSSCAPIYAKWIRIIDNHHNVMTYKYTTENERRSDVVLLKNTKFSFLNHIEVPGITSVEQNDNIIDKFFQSQTQTPQGLCITDEFIMTTSYSEADGCLGELVIYGKKSGSIMVVLGLDENSHLGGLTFDGKNVWVCNSHEGTIERISYDFIQLMAYENSGKYVDATSVVDSYEVSNRPSCISYYDGRLWIATHTKYFDSEMVAYHYDSNHNKLSKLSSYNIPARVQGVAFDEHGRVFLSTSYGRDMSSFLKIYNSLVDMDVDVAKTLITVEMPPASEEIDVRNNKVYILFESASEVFLKGTDGYGVCDCPINKILVIDFSEEFQ